MILIAIVSAGIFLKATFISTFHPLLYNFVQNDTAYTVSTDGYIYPIVWGKDEKLRFIMLDSIDLGIRDITFATHFEKGLILGTSEGAFLYRKKSLKKLTDKKVYWISQKGEKVFILEDNRLNILENERLVRSISLNGRYIHVLNDSILVVSGTGIVYFVDFNQGMIKEKFKKQGFDKFIWDRIRRNNPHIYIRPSANGSKSALFFSGYNSETRRSVLFFISKSRKEFLPIEGIPSFIEYKEGNFWVFYESGSYCYLDILNEDSLNMVGNFRFNSPVTDVSNLYRNYWYVITWGGLGYLFKKRDYHKFYNFILTQGTEKIFSGSCKYDFDHDGDQDLMLIATSSWDSDPYEKNWAVLFLENRIPEYISKAKNLYMNARKNNNLIHCEKALNQIESALEIFSVLLPEKIGEGMKLREEIYRKVIFKSRLKKAARVLGKLLALLFFPLGLILFLYSKYRKEKELSRSIPTAETITLILSTEIFHKFSSKWYPVFESGILINVEQINGEIREIIKLLSIPNIRYEFLNAPRRWRKFYRALMFHLITLSILLKIYGKAKFLRPYLIKLLRKSVRKIGVLRNEFKDLTNRSKRDVITYALLPVIEKFRKDLSKSDIQIKTDIKTEIPFLYYPDEIEKFKSAFKSLIENAVESFEDFKPENEPPTILIKVRSTVSELTIEISDNGKGIPEEILPFVFQEGFTYGKSKDSKGLGMSNARMVIEKYGKIKIQSHKGEGTKIVIKLLFGKREVQS